MTDLIDIFVDYLRKKSVIPNLSSLSKSREDSVAFDSRQEEDRVYKGTFSGSDLQVFIITDKVQLFGSCNALSWVKARIDDSSVTVLKLTEVIFNESTKIPDGCDLLVQMENEYGSCSYIKFSGLHEIACECVTSVDSVVVEVTKFYLADEVSDFISGKAPEYVQYKEELGLLR